MAYVGRVNIISPDKMSTSSIYNDKSDCDAEATGGGLRPYGGGGYIVRRSEGNHFLSRGGFKHETGIEGGSDGAREPHAGLCRIKESAAAALGKSPAFLCISM